MESTRFDENDSREDRHGRIGGLSLGARDNRCSSESVAPNIHGNSRAIFVKYTRALGGFPAKPRSLAHWSAQICHEHASRS